MLALAVIALGLSCRSPAERAVLDNMIAAHRIPTFAVGARACDGVQRIERYSASVLVVSGKPKARLILLQRVDFSTAISWE